jgi:hypothetical protein
MDSVVIIKTTKWECLEMVTGKKGRWTMQGQATETAEAMNNLGFILRLY